MTKITLIGNGQAKGGYEFTYLGPSNECKECRLKGVCFQLEEGRRYKIIGLRERQHECKLHEGGVRVVEVEALPIPMAIEDTLAVEGSTVKVEPIDCDNLACKHYLLCNPPGIKKGMKMKVDSVTKGMRCVKGNKLKEVALI